MNDRRIVVADRDTRKINFFDRTGRHLSTVGGLGGGPGEFRDIDYFERRGSNLVVYDGNRAVHLLDGASGKLVRRVALPHMAGFLTNPAVGIMRDQSILFAARKMERPVTEPGTFPDSLALFRVADTTTFVEWFSTGVMHRASGARAAYLVGFGARTRQVVFDDRRCHGFTARYEIRCTSPAGRLLLTIVREIPARPVTNRERTAYRRALSGFRSDGSNRFQEASLREHRARVAEETAFAKTHPAWFDLMASQSGDLWVRDYAAADGARSGYVVFPKAASTWSVFNAQGKWLASVTLPKGFVPTDIGDDYVLGVTQDEDEVERATMYRLVRSP